MDKWENWQWIIFILPLVLGMSSTGLCNLRNSGKKLEQRPSPWIFGIVWPILFLLLGTAWNFSIIHNKNNHTNTILMYIFYSLLLVSLVIWPWVFCNNKKTAMFLILIQLILCLSCWSISPNYAQICISPLIVWLLFALMLNYHII